MRLRNTSKYPADEVRRLVEFGMRGVRTTRLAVHVRNSRRGYRGMAYEAVPRRSPRSRQATVDRLVTLGIGDGPWPSDNMTHSFRWLRWQPAGGPVPEGYDSANWTYESRRTYLPRPGAFGDGSFIDEERYGRVERHPYGGKRSPLIVLNDWREALVAIAAHEARHVWQFQHNKPRSEVDAERFAARALERFREETTAR